MGEEVQRLSILFIASVVNLTAALWTDAANFVWAVTCPSVSIGFCLFVILLEYSHPGFCENLHSPLSFFLGFWWTAGLMVMTFDRPYTVTGNGYFSVWAAFIVSWFYARHSNDYVKSAAGEMEGYLLSSGGGARFGSSMEGDGSHHSGGGGGGGGGGIGIGSGGGSGSGGNVSYIDDGKSGEYGGGNEYAGVDYGSGVSHEYGGGISNGGGAPPPASSGGYSSLNEEN